MKIEAMSATASALRTPPGLEAVPREGREAREEHSSPEARAEETRVAPEEVLGKIRELTEGGVYSVRFELNREVDRVVVKVVDQESGEVKRQIPAEELLNLSKNLKELRGLLFDIQG